MPDVLILRCEYPSGEPYELRLNIDAITSVEICDRECKDLPIDVYYAGRVVNLPNTPENRAALRAKFGGVPTATQDLDAPHVATEQPR